MCDIFDTLKVYFVADLRSLIKILDHFWTLILDQHADKIKKNKERKLLEDWLLIHFVYCVCVNLDYLKFLVQGEGKNGIEVWNVLNVWLSWLYKKKFTKYAKGNRRTFPIKCGL